MRIVPVLLGVLIACGGDDPDTTPDSAMPDAADLPDAPPPPPATGTIPLPDCTGLSGIAEPCTLVTNADACTTARCTKLVVLFSGGESGCTNAGYTSVLADYATAGWAAVCIDAFETADGSAAVPYLAESPRYDLAVTTATTGAWGQTYWTGDELLLAGISHGASAPLIAIARTDLDTMPAWRGATKTAACMLDGTYDQYVTMEFLRTGNTNGGPCLAPVSFRRWLERYCGPGATVANCDLPTHPDAIADTIVAAPVAGFAVTDLRLVECGSATPVCTSDILPAAPIEALCSHVDASPDHTCTYVSDPATSHIGCLGAHAAGCRPWFDALP